MLTSHGRLESTDCNKVFVRTLTGFNKCMTYAII